MKKKKKISKNFYSYLRKYKAVSIFFIYFLILMSVVPNYWKRKSKNKKETKLIKKKIKEGNVIMKQDWMANKCEKT